MTVNKKLKELQELAGCANITLDDVFNDNVTMNEAKKNLETIILENHNYNIYYSKAENAWRTYLPDETKKAKRKAIKRTSKENLEKAIIEYYKSNQKQKEEEIISLESLYPNFLELKAKESSLANAHKLNWVWDKYYKDQPITKCDISEITVSMLKEWLLDKIAEFSLTNRKYKEMKSLCNMLFDYAIDSKNFSSNPARMIHNISRKKFTKEQEKSYSEQVYNTNEEIALVDIALQKYDKTKNIAYLGICLNFFLALRVGELVALKLSDITDTGIHIQRQEVKSYKKSDDNRIIRNGYEISDYVKSVSSDRILPLSESAKKFIELILSEQRKRATGSKDKDFLFLNRNGNRIRNDAINNALRRCNKEIHTTQKGNHSIRKTTISNLSESGLLSPDEIRDFSGHADFATTQKCYIHSTKRNEERQTAYVNALDMVFNSVQN